MISFLGYRRRSNGRSKHGDTRSIVNELNSRDIEGDQMEGESGVTPSIIDKLHSSDIQGIQIEGESGVTRSISDELHSWDMQQDQMEDESMVLLEVPSINFIFGIYKESKWKL